MRQEVLIETLLNTISCGLKSYLKTDILNMFKLPVSSIFKCVAAFSYFLVLLVAQVSSSVGLYIKLRSKTKYSCSNILHCFHLEYSYGYTCPIY